MEGFASALPSSCLAEREVKVGTTKFADKEYKRLTINDICDEGCINVLEAFLDMVGKEYRFSLEAYCEHPTNEEYKKRYESSVEFIKSKYFTRLTNLNGENIIDSMNRIYISGR